MSSNMEIIRECIQKEATFFGRTDELFITIFLEACDNDVEKSKLRIVRYYELRRLYPRLMTNRDCLNEKHMKMFRQKIIYSDFLNENCELPVVLTIKASRLESDDNMYDAFRGLIFVIETGILHSARFRKYGGIGIYDLENLKFTHVLQITPNFVMQTMKCILEGLPFKCHKLLFINAGSMLRAAISVGALFRPPDIRNIITISSGSWDSIRDKVSPPCLPIEYGGTNGTLEEAVDESFIAPFLDICGNDVERTKQRIVRYYELRRLYPRLMTNRDCLNEKHEKLFRQKVVYCDVVNENDELLPVMVVKASGMELNDNVCDALRAFIITIETGLLHSARIRKYGGITILDFKDMKLTHILQSTPNLIMQAMKCLFEGMPGKCKAVIFINVGSMMKAALRLGSLFLPTEIQNIMTISSGSWESIKDKVSPQSLPIEYGGTNGTLEENLELLEAIFMKWRDYLLDDERYGFNK